MAFRCASIIFLFSCNLFSLCFSSDSTFTFHFLIFSASLYSFEYSLLIGSEFYYKISFQRLLIVQSLVKPDYSCLLKTSMSVLVLETKSLLSFCPNIILKAMWTFFYKLYFFFCWLAAGICKSWTDLSVTLMDSLTYTEVSGFHQGTSRYHTAFGKN